MANRRDSFLALTRSEKGILIAACVLLPLLWLTLRSFGFRRTVSLLGRFGRGKDVISGIDEVRRLSGLIDTAANNGLRRANCLERSLLLWWILRRRGGAAEIRFGASNESSAFKAHAWVEWNGVVLNDRADIASEFPPFTNANTNITSSEVPAPIPGGDAR